MELKRQHHTGATIRPDLRPNRTWGTDRVCDTPGCETRLSVYNGSSSCSVHEVARVYVVRGRRRSAHREEVVDLLAS